MERWRALTTLVHDAVDAVTGLVGEGHASTGRWIERGAGLLPGEAGDTVRLIERMRGRVTDGVIDRVLGVNALVRVLTDGAWSIVPGVDRAPDPLPLSAEALWTPAGAIDQLVGLINGAVGDHLRRRDNALDLGLSIRDRAGVLSDRIAAPRPSSLVVSVHGLGTTELSWVLDADDSLGDPEATLGGRLAEVRGASDLYVRYNTGVGIADNGRALAEALQAVVDAWPGPVDDLVLVGHSMGGLVARAAAHHAAQAGMSWRQRLSHGVTVGTPHLGAPLARVGHTAASVLTAVDLPATRVLGLLLDGRSDGIQDLKRPDPDRLGPLAEDVRWVLVSGSVQGDADGLAARTVGDLLVTSRSAAGPDTPPTVDVTRHHVDGVLHQSVQTDPRVVRMVVEAVGTRRRADQPSPSITEIT